MELDFFNETLKLAFEFQGKQHVEGIPFFHGQGEIGDKKFASQLQRDFDKKKLCEGQGILLIELFYSEKPNEIYEKIKNIRNELLDINENSDNNESDDNESDNKIIRKNIAMEQNHHICKNCEKTFSSEGFLNKHIEKKVCHVKFICPRCGKDDFRDRDVYNKHIKRKYPCVKKEENEPLIIQEKKETPADKIKNLEDNWENIIVDICKDLIKKNKDNIIIDNIPDIMRRFTKIFNEYANEYDISENFIPPIPPPPKKFSNTKLIFPINESKYMIHEILRAFYGRPIFMNISRIIFDENGNKKEITERKKLEELIVFKEIDDFELNKVLEVKVKGKKFTPDYIRFLSYRFSSTKRTLG